MLLEDMFFLLNKNLLTKLVILRHVLWECAGVQPQWIQGIRSGDGVGKLDTIALIKY